MKSISLSFLGHFKIGLFTAFWLTLFLVFIGPFDTAELSIQWRAEVMYVYGIVFLCSYMSMVPVQNLLFKRLKYWNWLLEGLIILLVYTLSLIGSFAYYTSDIINGNYEFEVFLLEIYIPTALVLFPMLGFGRWYIGKQAKTVVKKVGKNLSELGIDQRQWKLKIEDLLQQEVYLKHDISLSSIADQLNTNSSLLSKIINEGYGLNFNDFINKYRIEAVIKALKSGNHSTHTLQGIAENCGFKSKATFNRAFKKHTEMSPTDYLAKILTKIK
jgi:AraC-like DNA-binding protein